VKIASPTFYSLRDSRTPVLVSVASVATNLVLNITLVKVLGFRGLALGTAVAALFNAGALLLLLRGRLGGIDGRRLAIATLKIAVASAVMGAAAALALRWLVTALPGEREAFKVARVSLAIGAAVIALVVSARVLRIEEFTDAITRVLRRIGAGRR
jgi:putative peptidoglycan lipid II flippase